MIRHHRSFLPILTPALVGLTLPVHRRSWSGKFIIREVADDRCQQQPLGDWKFV